MKRRHKRKIFASSDPVSDAIEVFSVENGTTKMWDKIRLNSDYKALSSNVFTFYNPIASKEITDNGKKFMDKMNKSYEKLVNDEEAMKDLHRLHEISMNFHSNTERIEKEEIEKLKSLSTEERNKIKDIFKLS